MERYRSVSAPDPAPLREQLDFWPYRHQAEDPHRRELHPVLYQHSEEFPSDASGLSIGASTGAMRDRVTVIGIKIGRAHV